MRQVVNSSFYFSFDVSLIAILNVSGLVLVFELFHKNWAFFFFNTWFSRRQQSRTPVFFQYVPLFTREE
jgi:hypothetical protein